MKLKPRLAWLARACMGALFVGTLWIAGCHDDHDYHHDHDRDHDHIEHHEDHY